MTTIYLVRHGEYENPGYVFPGRLPGFGLSDHGRQQVARLARFLTDKGITAIISSPLRRTRETAAIISDTLKLPIRFDLRLIEVRTVLDGTSMKPFDESGGELSYMPDQVAHGSESMTELADRMHRVLEEIRKAHKGKTVLVVSHGDPIRFGIMQYLKKPITFPQSREFETPLAGGYRLEIDDKGVASVTRLELGT